MKCSKCKNKLKKGMKFCPVCGARIEKRTGRKIISVLLIVTLLLSIIAIGWIAKHSSGKSFFDLFGGNSTVKINSVEEAIEHAKEFGEECGYENAMAELTEKITTTIDGDTYYRLQQNYQGIPVYGRTVVYATDEGGSVISVTGNALDVSGNIDSAPTITYKQAITLVDSYFYNNYGIKEISQNISSDLAAENLYIYNMTDEAVLVYAISTGTYEILVDAHNSEIISIRQTLNVNSINADQSDNTFNYVWKNIDGTYVLRDCERNIYIYDAGGNTYWDIYNGKVDPSVLTLVTSKDNVFGNKDDSTNTASVAVSFLQDLSSAYDYYQETLSETGCGAVVGIYDDMQGVYNGSNAGGGLGFVGDSVPMDPPDYNREDYNGQIGTVILGSQYSNDLKAGKSMIDTIGHEYTHYISDKYVSWCHSVVINMDTGELFENHDENGAICEALSDIFGELIEYNVKGEIDWTHDDRTMYDPTVNKYPNSVSQKVVRDENGWVVINGGGTDYSHGYSTVISHAAYLMWHGGVFTDRDKQLSEIELAKLWYRAMLMMSSDCDFIECRALVELAASTMNLTDLQIQCVSEAFDAVGIYTDNPEETQIDYIVMPDSTLSVLDKNGQPYSGYTLEIYGFENDLRWKETADGKIAFYFCGLEYEKVIEVSDNSTVIDIPHGCYNFTISDYHYPEYTYSFTVSVSSTGTDDEIVLYTNYGDIDAYEAYISAAKKITASGSWSENFTMAANMSITNGSAKTKTKVTMTSNTNVSNYSESDLSKIQITGSAEMSVMGQTYAWDMQYENGIAHYQYTKPNQTSADMAIDPGFFNFNTMTSDMMTNAKLSGNKITFTVPGDKITEVGIAAVDQISGVDDLKYGDVDVAVTINAEGKIDTIIMTFDASMEYQGYDADVEYNITYGFSDSFDAPISSSVTITPGIYAQDGSSANTLTVHETNEQVLEFTAFWYRVADISNVSAILDGNIASFDYTSPNGNWRVTGTLQSPAENEIILTISESTHEYIGMDEYRYSLIGKKFTDAELKEISAALSVPDGLDTQITQGEPVYWEGGGFYRTSIGIYYNGKWIAGASVNSLTGELVGNIYVYDGSANNIDIASTFGFTQAWDIHDESGTEHFVTSLAFLDDSTFCCGVGWYLSEWYTAFTGTYQVSGNEVILHYTLNGEEKITSYQVNWEDQTLKQTSEENLVIAHQKGSEHPFEENPWYTAEELKNQVELVMRYNG